MTLMSANSTHPRRLTAVSSLAKALLTGPATRRQPAAAPPHSRGRRFARRRREFRASLDGAGPSPVTLTSSGMCPRHGGQAGEAVTVTGGTGGEGASGVPAGPEHQPGTLAPPGPEPATAAGPEPGPTPAAARPGAATLPT